jgi:hypothetical protein
VRQSLLDYGGDVVSDGVRTGIDYACMSGTVLRVDTERSQQNTRRTICSDVTTSHLACVRKRGRSPGRYPNPHPHPLVALDSTVRLNYKVVT